MPGDNVVSYTENAPGGWIPAGETWTYSAADAPTFTFTITSDLTSEYSPGMRIRLNQATGGTKYGIITKITYGGSSSTVTVYMGTDYTLNNEAILAPYYSMHESPFGFPLDPAKWTVEVTDTSDRAQATPTVSVWYNLGSLSISVPIGCWRLFYDAVVDISDNGATIAAVFLTLSTANNSASDTGMTGLLVSGSERTIGSVSREKFISLTSKQTQYLNAMTNQSGANAIDIRGDLGKTVIRAVCAYL